MFVLNNVMSDDMKYCKWHTSSINVAQVHVSVVTKYDFVRSLHCECDVQQQHNTSNKGCTEHEFFSIRPNTNTNSCWREKENERKS